MAGSALIVIVDPTLRAFLRSGRRCRGAEDSRVEVQPDGTSTLGHVVQSLGVPLTETGALRVDGRTVPSRTRAPAGGTLEVAARSRPQPAPTSPPRFLLDVHLGALARRLRLLGLDTAYRNDAEDDELVVASRAERRVLLTRDRGLLMRRAVLAGAYVRGQDPGEQLVDVLDRFDPPLRPWTRCLACNGDLEPVDVSLVADQLHPGTLRTCTDYVRCTACGRPFWRGAHAPGLDDVVRAALASRSAGRDGHRRA